MVVDVERGTVKLMFADLVADLGAGVLGTDFLVYESQELCLGDKGKKRLEFAFYKRKIGSGETLDSCVDNFFDRHYRAAKTASRDAAAESPRNAPHVVS